MAEERQGARKWPPDVRLELARRLLQVMIASSPEVRNWLDADVQKWAEHAVAFADALLEALRLGESQ